MNDLLLCRGNDFNQYHPVRVADVGIACCKDMIFNSYEVLNYNLSYKHNLQLGLYMYTYM